MLTKFLRDLIRHAIEFLMTLAVGLIEESLMRLAGAVQFADAKIPVVGLAGGERGGVSSTD